MTPSRLVYWSTVAVATGIVAVAPGNTAAQFGDPGTPDVYTSKRSFFERSGFGALAVMPHVTSESEAANEYEYIALPSSGRYDITHPEGTIPNWWFIVNHRSGSRASTAYTYVGVFIAKRLESPQRDSVELFRNAEWLRLGDTLDAFNDNYQSRTDFFELQDSTSRQESFEQEFGNWHAIPDKDNDESSWLERDNWLSRARVAACFSAVGGTRPTDDNVYYQARLIRFRVTRGLNSRQPVAWEVTLDDADAFFLKTFSPEGIDMDREYCVFKG